MNAVSMCTCGACTIRTHTHTCLSLLSSPGFTALNVALALVLFISVIFFSYTIDSLSGVKCLYLFTSESKIQHRISPESFDLKPVLIGRSSQAPNWQISHMTHYARPMLSSCFLYKPPSSHHLNFYAVSDLVVSVLTHAFFVLVLSTWTHRRTWHVLVKYPEWKTTHKKENLNSFDCSNLACVFRISLLENTSNLAC